VYILSIRYETFQFIRDVLVFVLRCFRRETSQPGRRRYRLGQTSFFGKAVLLSSFGK
jgi:hypothetical protein